MGRGLNTGIIHCDEFGHPENPAYRLITNASGIQCIKAVADLEEGDVAVPHPMQSVGQEVGLAQAAAAQEALELPEGAVSAQELTEKFEAAMNAQLANGVASKDILEQAIVQLRADCEAKGLPYLDEIDARSIVQLNAIRKIRGLPVIYTKREVAGAAKELGYRKVNPAKAMGRVVHLNSEGSKPMRNPTKVPMIAKLKDGFLATCKAQGMGKKQALAAFETAAAKSWERYQQALAVNKNLPKTQPDALAHMLNQTFGPATFKAA